MVRRGERRVQAVLDRGGRLDALARKQARAAWLLRHGQERGRRSADEMNGACKL